MLFPWHSSYQPLRFFLERALIPVRAPATAHNSRRGKGGIIKDAEDVDVIAWRREWVGTRTVRFSDGLSFTLRTRCVVAVPPASLCPSCVVNNPGYRLRLEAASADHAPIWSGRRGQNKEPSRPALSVATFIGRALAKILCRPSCTCGS